MGRTLDQVAWQHRLANHLADRGVPAARALGLVEHGGHWYEVHEPAAGEDVYAGADSWDPFASEAHAAAAGRGPGAPAPRRRRLPRPLAPAAGRLRRPARRRCDAAGQRRSPRWPMPARRSPTTSRGGRGRTTWPRRTAPVFERLRPLVPVLPRAPLHGDWQTNNLFFSGDEVSGIIDFHQADYGPRTLDLAVAVERNCFFWNRISAGDDAAFDLGHAAALVGAYDAVAPLMPDERDGVRRRPPGLPVRVRDLVPRLLLGRRARPREGRLGLGHLRPRPRPLVGVRPGPRCACRRRADRRRRLTAAAGAAGPSRATPRPPPRGRSPTRSRRPPRGGSRRPRSRTSGS